MTYLGNYEIHGMIGEGGFGQVFKGSHPVLKRDVAIKVCTVQQQDFKRRFLREAEIAAGLRHPNIVTVYDIGEANGEPYLVQEYLDGEDLDAVIRRRDPLPIGTKVAYLAQIADALAYAHSRGVVHRDIKPSNIRVPVDGQLRILDFGIAKLVDDELHLTRTGFSVGTAGYLAPEQLRGEKIDHRADIFSFGILAYEFLTYQKPFNGESISAVYFQIAHEHPAPIEPMLPDCPPRLAAVVMRCLQKNAGDRFANCVEIVAELTVVLEGVPPGVAATGAFVTHPIVDGPDGDVPVTRRDRHASSQRFGTRWIYAAAAAVGAIAIATFMWNGVNAKTPPPTPSSLASAAPVAPPPDTLTRRDTNAVPYSHVQSEADSTRKAVVKRPQPSRSNASPGSPKAAASVAMLDDGLIVLAIGRDSLEKTLPGPTVARTVESGLSDLLNASGLRVAPRADASMLSLSRDAYAAAGLMARGRAAGAALALGGVVSVVEQPGALDMKSARCTLELRVVEVKTGKVVAEALEDAPGPGGSIEMASDRAVRSCLKKAGDRIVRLLDARR